MSYYDDLKLRDKMDPRREYERHAHVRVEKFVYNRTTLPVTCLVVSAPVKCHIRRAGGRTSSFEVDRPDRCCVATFPTWAQRLRSVFEGELLPSIPRTHFHRVAMTFNGVDLSRLTKSLC